MIQLQQKPPNKFYFTEETEKAIIDYNNSNDNTYRNQIYHLHLEYAFDKMTESLINKYRFYYISDTFAATQNRALEFILSKLKEFNPERGKAYSFFTRITINFLIQENNKAYQNIKKKRTININDDDEILDNETNHTKLEFYDILIPYLDKNFLKIFDSTEDRKIVDAILILLKRCHNLENLRKKSIYIYIREITDINKKDTIKITKTTKKLKILFKHLYNIYIKEDKLDLDYIPNLNELELK
jgi:hypothetical protein